MYYLHFQNIPLEPLSFHLNLLSSVCRVHVERKLTSSAVMWARLHCSPLELSLQRLLAKQISGNRSPLPLLLSGLSGLLQPEAGTVCHLCLLQGSGGPGFASTRGMTTFSAMSVSSENVGYTIKSMNPEGEELLTCTFQLTRCRKEMSL